MKKLTVFLLAIIFCCTNILFFACKDDNPQNDNKILITDEPDGYTEPIFDVMTADYTQPSLTDEQMYKTVFETRSQKYLDVTTMPDPDCTKGEAVFIMMSLESSTMQGDTITSTYGYDYGYLCHDISTQITIDATYNRFTISHLTEYEISYQTYPVNNRYWQQYFSVMLDNEQFNDALADDYNGFVMTKVYDSTTERTYTFWEDGKITTIVDNKTMVGDKLVDSPKIRLVSFLFKQLDKSRESISISDKASLSTPFSAPIQLHYNGKIAQLNADDINNLLKVKPTQSVEHAKDLNRLFFTDKDYAFFFRNDNKDGPKYVITSDGTLYYTNFCVVSDTIISSSKLTGYQLQITYSYKNVFDFGKIKDLFK